jgi:hypothetical protein
MLDKQIVLASLRYRQAVLQRQQNDGEVANGGRDDGSNLERVEDAEQVLDALLRQRFGAGWDLRRGEF